MKRIVVAVVLLSFIGCTQPGEQIGVGAATGGVIGAGLGAIIGNQVGNAGTGLAIGAAAGAATGGLIANAFEAQGKAIKTQDEAIERQEQRLAAQRAEIEEFRKMNSDPQVARTATTLGSSTSTYRRVGSASHIRLNPPNLSGTQFDTSARASLNASAVRDVSVMQPGTSESGRNLPPRSFATGSLLESDLSTSSAAETARKVDQDAALERARSIDATTTAASIGAGSTFGDGASFESSPAVTVQPAKKQAASDADMLDVEEPKAAPVARLPKAEDLSPDCRQAEDEAKQAKNASDNADKLFHFRRALRLCPSKAEFHIGLGEVYQAMNRKSDADFEFNEALRLDPNSEVALDLLSKSEGN